MGKGGEPPRQENLCHFVRVLLFWAPLRWFAYARAYGVVAPWSVTLAVTTVTSLMMFPMTTLGALGMIVAVAVGLFFILRGVAWLNKNEDWLEETVGRPLAEFLSRPLVGRLPISFFLASAVTAIGLRFAFPVSASILIALTFIGLIVGLIGVLIMIGVRIEDYMIKRLYAWEKQSGFPGAAYTQKKPGVLTAVWRETRGILRIALDYVKAKKQKICPFIEIVDLDAERV